MQETRILYPSTQHFQNSNEDSVSLNWAIGYLQQLRDAIPADAQRTAMLHGWTGNKVAFEATLSPMEILERRTAKVEASLRQIAELLPAGDGEVTLTADQVRLVRSIVQP